MIKQVCLVLISLAISTNVQANLSETEVLTKDEAAVFLKLEAKKIEELTRQQQIPARNIAGEWRFSKPALLAWLNNSPLDNNVSKDHSAEADDPQIRPADAELAKEPSTKKRQDMSDEIEAILMRDRASLNASNAISGELDVSYSKQSTQVLLLGAPSMVNVDKKQVSTTAILRYGFGDGYQLRACLPYQAAFEKANVDNTTIFKESSSKFGPARVGVQKQLFSEGPGYPGMIVGVSGVFGDIYGIAAEASVSKILDPAIMFASLQFEHHFNQENQPENFLMGQVGFGLKLNDDLAAQVALIGHFTGQVESTNIKIPPKDDYGVNVNLSWRILKDFYIQPFFETSLTGNGSDMTIGSALIYTPSDNGG